ncbi:MAG: IS1634 family transposase [Actinomycetota bacterium]|nr:IS1634 family transposase [Actinomycetota bacterium]
MYLRTTQRRRKDGSLVRYLQLAHNRREGGVTRAEVLLNLGREDRLDSEGLRRLARSISRYTDPGLEGGEPIEAAEGLEVVGSRPLGGAWLLDALWRRLGVAEALRELLGTRRFATDVERVLFALVCNRALAPCSKLAAAEWASEDVAIPGLERMDDDQAYRALDLLVEADAEAKVQEAVFFACADLLNLEVDLLFFDTTSTYFEAEPDSAEGAEDQAPFRALGHSKDHRPDLPQVVIGLAVTREGIPVRVWVWPGNTNDQTVITEVKDDLRGWRLGRCVWVVDRGFSADDNLRYLTRGGGHWIAGERMRDGSPDAQAALARPGRYQTVRDNLRVKDVRLGEGDTIKRFVVCHNPAEAERDKAERDGQLARLEAELARIELARRRAKTAKTREAHTRAECALRDHPTLSRYLRQTKSGRLLIDRRKVAVEERLDGKYLLSSSDPDLSAEEIALGYKNLREAERSFRDLKTTLELRPVFHRLEHRIRAHVVVCWLALLLIRIAERKSGQSWRRIATELQRLHLVTLQGAAGTVEQTTRLTDAQHEILAALEVEPPPRITALEPA